MEITHKIYPNKIIILWLIFIIIIINLIFLKDFWGYGIIWEDWQFLLNFKTEYNTNNLLLKVFKFWTLSPVHWGTQISYLGLFDLLFPSNYIIIQIFNVIGKITATVLLFPLIFVLTRNRLLAFLSAIFFAIHYSSAGSLQQYANGVEYWAISFLILFILIYRTIIIKEDYNPFKLLISFILLYLTLSFGLYRLNGFIVILAIIEGILFLTKKTSRISSSFRIAFFIVIPATIVFLVHHPTIGRESLPSTMINHILNGNWFIFINPLSGLALTFIPRPFLGGSDIALLQQFDGYISYVIKNFTLPFILIILTLGYVLPLKTRRFILFSLILICILIPIFFIIISHYTNYPRYDIVPTFIIGLFIFSLALSLGFEWWSSQRQNLLLLSSFLSPLITLFFTTVTWVLNINKDGSITYQDGVHRYLTVPAIGTTLFAASISTMIIQRKFNSQFQRVIGYGLIWMFIVFFIFASYNELKIYKILKEKGTDLKLQVSAQEFFYKTYIKNRGDIVIYYIAPPPQDLESYRIERAIAPEILNWLSYLRQYYLKGPNNEGLGCIMVLAFPWHQKEAIIKEADGKIAFYYPAMCPIDKSIKGKTYAENRWVTLPMDKLFAFTIQNGKVLDITKDVKEKIEQNISPEEITNSYYKI